MRPPLKKDAAALINDLAKLDASKLKAEDPLVVKEIVTFNTRLSKNSLSPPRACSAPSPGTPRTIKSRTVFKIGIKIVTLAVSVGVTAAAGWTGVGNIIKPKQQLASPKLKKNTAQQN